MLVKMPRRLSPKGEFRNNLARKLETAALPICGRRGGMWCWLLTRSFEVSRKRDRSAGPLPEAYERGEAYDEEKNAHAP